MRHSFSFPPPAELPTGNKVKNWKWQKAHRVSAEIRGYVKLRATSERNGKRIPPCPADQKRHVTFTLAQTGRQQEYDVDNLAMGLKCALDGLRDAGWISQDDPAHVAVDYKQERGLRPLLTVLIEDG